MKRTTCSIGECDGGPPISRGWCKKHYTRWKRTGDPLNVRPRAPAPPGLTTLERFWLKVDKNGPISPSHPELGPCWIWTGGTHEGYGVFNLPQTETQARRTVKAHRWAYQQHVEPISDNMESDHLCHSVAVLNHECDGGPDCPHRACVNYERHLEVVTKAVNRLRGQSVPARRARQIECLRGHLLIEPNLRPRTQEYPHRICKACSRTYGRFQNHCVAHPEIEFDYQAESDRSYQEIMGSMIRNLDKL